MPGVCTHELAEDFGRRYILRPARLNEGIPKVTIYADTKAYIFSKHVRTLSRGYTLVYPRKKKDTSANMFERRNGDIHADSRDISAV